MSSDEHGGWSTHMGKDWLLEASTPESRDARVGQSPAQVVVPCSFCYLPLSKLWEWAVLPAPAQIPFDHPM